MKITQSTLKALRDIPPSPITGEYYLTHIVSESHPFNILIEPPDALQGINTFEELKALEKLYQSQIYQDLLRQQVSVMHHETLNLINTEIGKGTHIDQQVTLRNSQIGENCKLGQGVILDRVKLSDDVTILPYSVLSDCSIGSGSTIGPFAHIQEQTIIGQKTYIGNFVEIKRSLIADGVKAKHLSYLGDAYVDTRANIGAGTITCNYVPWRKEKSISYVGSHALVGANCLLIAPCHIGPYTICAAGSVLQGNILPSQLAISRAPLSIRFSAKLRKEVEY